MSNVPGLLELLSCAASCSVLSDLPYITPPSHRLWLTLYQIDASAYPVNEWRDALFYLTGQTMLNGSGEECRLALLSYYQAPQENPIPTP